MYRALVTTFYSYKCVKRSMEDKEKKFKFYLDFLSAIRR